jgi:DNA primase
VEAMAYRGDVQLRVLTIPDGKDPDEFLRHHPASDYHQLVQQAPLWLDWQIDQTVAGRDLRQGDQFQLAVQAIVKLLGNLPNATLRTHYIHRSADRLSQGDSRLMMQLEEDLRLQVRGERWHGRSQKWQTSRDRTLLEEAEEQLLRVYLQAPEQRAAIVAALDARDLEFSLSHHRFLWKQILEIEGAAPAEAPSGLDARAESLMTALQDRCTEYPREMMQLYALFQSSEKNQRDILRADLTIRAATAAMERVLCEKRCRHFQQLWQDNDAAGNMELSDLYQQKIYLEKRRILALDHERQVTFNDLVQTPWVGS